MTDVIDLLDQVATLAEQHQAFLLTAGGLLLVTLVLLGWWARKRGSRGAAYRWAAGAVAVALSAEGMWEVATESLAFAPWKALLLFAFAELAMLNEAHQAKSRIQQSREPGLHGMAVWVIAVGAGLIAASNAANTAEYLLRLGAPTLLAWQWWSDLIADRPDRERQPSRWIWTPQRIGIRLGLLKPGSADDLTEVFRQRTIDRMVRVADSLDTADPKNAPKLALQLRRMAKDADPAVIAAVRERYNQGATIQEQIFGRVRVHLVDKMPLPALDEHAAVAPRDPWEYAEPIGPQTAPQPPADVKPRVSRPRAKTLTSAVKVAKVAAKMPAATVAEIAAKAGVSESTARRHMPAPAEPVEPVTVASPSGPDAAETTPDPAVNGARVELAEVTR